MPLYHNALDLIRANLETLENGGRVHLVDVGRFTDAEFDQINVHRAKHNMPALGSPEIVFIGSHMYESRAIKEYYTVDDIVTQVQHAFSATSVMNFEKGTALFSTVRRADAYGNRVLDKAVFELTTRKPKAELYSVMPKGDRNKPKQPGVAVAGPTPAPQPAVVASVK